MKLSDVVSKFSGASGEDIEQWLDRLAVAVQLTEEITLSTDDPRDDKAVRKKMVTLMPLLLHGSAYITWKRLPVTDRNDYEAIAKALRRVYGKTKSAAWRELKSLKLLPGESIDVLADQITTLLHVTTGGATCPEQIAAAFLLDAIPARIAEQVRLRHGEDMALDDIVSCAKALLAGSDGNPDMAAGALREGRSEDTTNANGGPNRGERGGGTKILRCFGCDRLGHAKRDCPTVCFRCHKRGHVQRKCPQDHQDAGNGQAEVTTPDRATPAEIH